MYAVFLSGKWRTNLSDAIKTRLIKPERISFAEEAIELTANNVNEILFDNIRKLKDWVHSQEPSKLKMKRAKFY